MKPCGTAGGERRFSTFFQAHGWLLTAGLLLAVLWGGGYVRFHQLGAQSFWIDEAFSTAHAQAIVSHGYPLLDTGEVSWSYFPAHYLMALGLVLTDDLQAGARLFSALAGTLACLAFFQLNWQLTRSKSQALLATLLLTFSTYEIAWSRQARGYLLLQLCGIVSIGCYLSFLREPRAGRLVGALAAAALCPLLHPAGYVFPLALLLLTAPELVRQHAWRAWFRAAPRRMAWGATLVLLLLGFAWAVHFTNADPRLLVRHLLGPAAGQGYGLVYLRFLHSILGATLWWSLAGAIAGVWLYPRRVVPLLAAVAAYFYLIALRNPLMHYRYLLPIIPFLLCLAALGAHSLTVYLWHRKTRVGRGLAIALGAAFLVAAGTMDWNVRPYEKYYLGATEPQPEWRAAYARIQEDLASRDAVAGGRAGASVPVTISAFPVFHDLYLGRQGEKYFLPVSLTGWADDVPAHASYARAQTVHSMAELAALKGYIILDEMGLTMLCDARIQEYLQSQKPDFVIPGFYKIYIWKKG